jgi:DNA-binding NtrC family response regulator
MKKRLFIVDDDSSVRDALKSILEQAGYDVMVAQDGNEALAQINRASPDLLILDLNMPRVDGWDVLEELSTTQPLLPVIVITGMYDQLATLNIPGVVALLKKPVEVASFLAMVEQLLAERLDERLRRVSRSYESPLIVRTAGASLFHQDGVLSEFRSNQSKLPGHV